MPKLPDTNRSTATPAVTAEGDATMKTGAGAPRPLLECLTRVARHYGLDLKPDRLDHDYNLPARDLVPGEVVRLARRVGMKAKVARFTWERLIRLGAVFPVIAPLTAGRAVIVIGLRQSDAGPLVELVDPLAARPDPMFLTREQFADLWQGKLILLRRIYALTTGERPFGLGWFVSEVWAERAAFRDVAVGALVLHVLALTSPLFFQVVIDKVLTHNSFATLYVLTVGVVAAILFEAAFTFLRRHLLLAATSKIDVRLGIRTFAHLLALPVSFFERVAAGITVRHMQQVERIRQFLTGRLFLTALDATTLLIFLPVMLLFSVPLTLVVLAFSGVMVLVILVMLEPFRKRLSELYSAEAERQSMLVETIHGMRTVKSSALEPLQRRKWDQSIATAVQMQYRVAKMSILAQTCIQVLEKLMPVAVIGIGASAVVDHTLSVGALIAFQMLSGRVMSPLVQIVSLIPDYQETVLSVHMLGEVMNQKPERPAGATGLCPPITGHLEFERVCFRYTPEGPLILDNISVRIPPGAVVGIVGRSGSGKTTLTRLIQGMSTPQDGVIRFDGIDSREIDLAHLRRNIGVVLQDNFLFRGSVRENIAITRPGASTEEVAAVARLAGASEFIERLPQGFETRIEENAANLSGGQRQRLAIARALLVQPRLLILDEATSALDPDSEAIFMDNLESIVAGRTVLIVSHRLTTLVRCTAIIVMDRGRIVDGGTHNDLLQRCDIYRHLWQQQNRQH